MESVNINKMLRLFNKLSKPEQLEVADKIQKQTFKERRKLMTNPMSFMDTADDDIIQEAHTSRYGSERFGLL